MKNISFSMTIDQFKLRNKTVTRRLGWKNLKHGQLLMGCKKCIGLRSGEKIEKLGIIRVKSVRREPLCSMEVNPVYGKKEALREGFPHLTGQQFVEMFAKALHCDKTSPVTRIEYEYI